MMVLLGQAWTSQLSAADFDAFIVYLKSLEKTANP
jgi:hypothetical protein